MDREAWRAAIHGVAKSRTWLSDWIELNWTCIVGVPEERKGRSWGRTYLKIIWQKNQIFWKTHLLIKEAWQTPFRIRMKKTMPWYMCQRFPRQLSVSVVCWNDLIGFRSCYTHRTQQKDTDQNWQGGKAHGIKSKRNQVQASWCPADSHRAVLNPPVSDPWQHVQSVAN